MFQLLFLMKREDTLITIQIDQMLAEKFGMEYIDSDGTKKNPYIIHRTSIGCYERTLALLLEKYAGALPTWLMPTQAVVIPISEKHVEYAEKLSKMLTEKGIRNTVDARNEKMGYKIREAQLEKTPYMLIAGDQEAADGTVSLRARKEGDTGVMAAEKAIEVILDDIINKRI